MKDRKPIIGLCSSYEKDENHDRIFLNHEYLEAIRYFGGMPLVIPAEAGEEEQAFLLSQCDGLILTGGDDIDPALYGEQILNDTVKIAPVRDAGEARLCRMATERDLPILGICRGLQFLNVYFGGTLYQDIPAQLPQAVGHSMEKPDHRTCQECLVTPDSPLAQWTGRETIGINSHHHQCIKDLAPGFSVMGRCADGVVEAVWKPDMRFLCAVQWHPERIWDIEENSAQIFRAFIEACNT